MEEPAGRGLHTRGGPEPDDRADLGVELAAAARLEVTLERRGRAGLEGVEEPERALDRVGRQLDAARGGDRRDFAHGASGELPRAGELPPGAGGGPHERADARHRRDEEQLHPERGVDVGGDLGAHSGGCEGLAQALEPRALPVVELAEADEGGDPLVVDVPGSDEVGDDAAEPGGDRTGAERRAEHAGRFDAVEQRHDDGRRADERRERRRDLGELPALDRHQHGVDRRRPRRGSPAARDRREPELAARAGQAQAARRERAQGLAAGDEDDLLPAREQAGSEVAADAAGPDHRDAHGATCGARSG